MLNEQSVMPEAMQGVQERASGIFDSIKQFFQPDALAATFHEWKFTLLDWSIYFGIGFFVGFLIKKYLKYILLLVLFVVSIVILEQFDILHLTVNWQKIQDLLNIKGLSTEFDAQVWSSYAEWVKANLAVVLSSSIGFFFGLKMG